MEFLREIWGLGRSPEATSQAEPQLDINAIRQKAAAHNTARQTYQQQERGVVPADKARAMVAQGQRGAAMNDLARFKQYILTLSNADLQKLYVELKQAGNDPVARTKQQIVFDELSSGRRPEQGYKNEPARTYNVRPRTKQQAPFTFG